MTKKFEMKSEFWEVKIISGTSDTLDLEIKFNEKEIPEDELRKLEAAIRLLLEATGRVSPNPSRR